VSDNIAHPVQRYKLTSYQHQKQNSNTN